MNRYDQATKGLMIRRGPRVVAVDDGADTWLCRREAFDRAETSLRELDAYGGDTDVDAYDDLVAAVKGPIASLSADPRGCIGGHRVDWESLVRDALDDSTISIPLAVTYGLDLDTEADRAAGIAWLKEHADGAVLADGRVIYYDYAESAWYVTDEAEDLGAMLRAGTEDVYSQWCSVTAGKLASQADRDEAGVS